MLYVFIASCIESLELHMERLKENVHPNMNVVIISGGHETEEEECIPPLLIIKVKYRCFEFTPFFYILKNPERFSFDYAFFTHDTVILGPLFYDRIRDIRTELKDLGYDTYRVNNKASSKSMNIGLYSKNIILSSADVLYENIHLDSDLMTMKHKLMCFEDYILNRNPLICDHSCNETEHVFHGTYSDNRSNGLIYYFEKIDMFKFQSNAYYIQSIDVPKLEGFPNYSATVEFFKTKGK